MAAIDRRGGRRLLNVNNGGRRLATVAAGLVSIALAGSAGAQTVALSQVEVLHQSLHLTQAQEGAWQLYRSASDIPEQAQSRRRAASTLFRTLDSPRRMDLVEAEVRQELADIQRQSQALKAFYHALSPEQQRIFDARTLPPPGDQGQQQF
jgi:uncharacterized tellurite resistance protein B-like protein